MTIIEFAYLSLPPPTTSRTPQLLKNLVTVRNVIQASSHLPTRFLSSITDENVMFVIGGWPSKTAHQDGFEGSAEQAKLFPLLEGLMGIDWMEYFSVEHQDVPTAGRVLVAVVVRCGFGRTEEGRTEIGKEVRNAVEGLLDKDGSREKEGGVPIVAAWNIKKGKREDEEDVFVLFSGWEDKGLARQFGESIDGMKLPKGGKKPEWYIMEKTELE